MYVAGFLGILDILAVSVWPVFKIISQISQLFSYCTHHATSTFGVMWNVNFYKFMWFSTYHRAWCTQPRFTVSWRGWCWSIFVTLISAFPNCFLACHKVLAHADFTEGSLMSITKDTYHHNVRYSPKDAATGACIITITSSQVKHVATFHAFILTGFNH